MEIKILNSIIYTELMPWTIDKNAIKALNEKIRQVAAKEPETHGELLQQISFLISPYPDIVAWLNKQNKNLENSLTNHYYTTELPEYANIYSRYYELLISKETLRILNAFLAKKATLHNKIDIIYHTTILLKNLKALIRQTFKEVKDRGFEETPVEKSDLSHFVLQYLKHQLMVLYFDVQEISKESLDIYYTVEDFYLTQLLLPKSSIQPLTRIEIESATGPALKAQKKLSFGFKGDPVKLKLIISKLCMQVSLLDELKCSQEHFFRVLTAKELSNTLPKIYVGCETTIFRDIIDKFKPLFSKLTPTLIETSGLFYSKNDHPIKAQNLYSSKIDNPKQEEKENIDNIFKQL